MQNGTHFLKGNFTKHFRVPSKWVHPHYYISCIQKTAYGYGSFPIPKEGLSGSRKPCNEGTERNKFLAKTPPADPTDSNFLFRTPWGRLFFAENPKSWFKLLFPGDLVGQVKIDSNKRWPENCLLQKFLPGTNLPTKGEDPKEKAFFVGSKHRKQRFWKTMVINVIYFVFSLSQWLNFKLFGITYLVGKIKFKLFFSGSIG